jgi:protein tyrosine kinase
MAGRVDVGIGLDGRPVAVKRANGPSASGRLAREAAALEAARHPGVVELVSVALDGDEPSITTAWVAGGSFEAALARSTPTPSLVALVADAAMTIAELHDRGVVHGRIDATHVLVGERGAVITGLAEASTDGEPADDVLALGHLLERVAAGRVTAPSRLSHRRDHDDDRIRHAIARATEPDAALRCPARVLARLLTEEAAPHSASERTRVVAPRARALPPLRARARAHSAVVVAAALAVVMAITGGFMLLSSDGGASVDVVAASTTTAVATTTASAETTVRAPAPVTSVVPTWPVPPTGCAQTATPYADVDGDGCPDEIAISAGAIDVAGHHFVMSVDIADIVVVGDWDCDGVATPAVLRVPSGAIDVVEHWPTNGEPTMTARRITVIEGAASVEARPRGEPGCATLAVGTPAGAQEVTW